MLYNININKSINFSFLCIHVSEYKEKKNKRKESLDKFTESLYNAIVQKG